MGDIVDLREAAIRFRPHHRQDKPLPVARGWILFGLALAAWVFLIAVVVGSIKLGGVIF